MKRTLILAVTLWLGVSATTHAQVNSPTNAASTVTGAVVPSGQGATGATGGGFSIQAPVLVPCPFGASLSAALTAFGCASDPLGAPTYQIPAEAGAVITGPVGIGANAHTVKPNATSGAGGAGGGVERGLRGRRRFRFAGLRRMLGARSHKTAPAAHLPVCRGQRSPMPRNAITGADTGLPDQVCDESAG